MADRYVIAQFLKAIKRTGASPREAKALFEAGITESGLRNLNYGDRDSKGALQQRASTGWAHAQDPYRAALDFLTHARAANKGGGSAGQLAQAVQRSAFPARYQQHSAEAERFLAGQTPSHIGGTSVRTTTTTPGVDNSGARGALFSQYIADPVQRHDPTALINLFGQLRQSGDVAPTSRTVTSPGFSAPADHGAVKAIFERAAARNNRHLPYQWGGGHGPTPAKPGVPVDCSGAVSSALGVSPRVAAQFKTYGQAGRGKRVTIYAAKDGHHVLMEVDGHFWGTSATNPGGGAGWIPRAVISSQYLKGFVARHPVGM
jgi:hypothetical protein